MLFLEAESRRRDTRKNRWFLTWLIAGVLLYAGALYWIWK